MKNKEWPNKLRDNTDVQTAVLIMWMNANFFSWKAIVCQQDCAVK